jgi:hypothetical protein
MQGSSEGYRVARLVVHQLARPHFKRWTWINPARLHCWWWKGVPLARPYCWWWHGIHPARLYFWWWKGLHTARLYFRWWKCKHPARSHYWWWEGMDPARLYFWWWKGIHLWLNAIKCTQCSESHGKFYRKPTKNPKISANSNTKPKKVRMPCKGPVRIFFKSNKNWKNRLLAMFFLILQGLVIGQF